MPFVNQKTGKGTTKELIVYPGALYDEDEIGVLVDGRTGRATNRWADGTIGLSVELKEAAAEETDAFDSEGALYVWKHPKTRKIAHLTRKSPKMSRPILGGMRR